MAQIINGRLLAQKHEQLLRKKFSQLNLTKKPVLVSFLIGDDPASYLYTSMKQKKACSLGIDFLVEKYPANVSFRKVAKRMSQFNDDPGVYGIMVQLPSLPGLKELISPSKDVDGLIQKSPFTPAVVRAVVSILDDERINLNKVAVTIVGYSNLIGKPLAKILKKRGAMVAACNSKTANLIRETQKADILITTVGKPFMITGNMVKQGAVVIDVGTSKLADGRIVGDVESATVAPKASKITPVPGGVGPMTVISLMENMFDALKR